MGKMGKRIGAVLLILMLLLLSSRWIFSTEDVNDEPTNVDINRGLLWHHTQLCDMLHGDSAIMLALTGAGGSQDYLVQSMFVVQHLLMKVSSLPQLHLLRKIT